MSKTILTKDRICTILRETLYSMADDKNQNVYEPLQLEWILPVESNEGIITAFKNLIFILDYVQKKECSKDIINQIIENEIRPIVSELSNEYDFFIAATIIIVCSIVDDYSNLDELMGLVKEVIGQFIGLLGMALKQFDSESDNQIADESIVGIDTSGLELGMVASVYVGQHASTHVISRGFSVIFNRRTSLYASFIFLENP